MRGADGDGQRVHARGLHELLHIFGLGVDRLGGHHVVLDAGQHAELALDGDVVLVSVLDHLAGLLDVLLERVVRPVDHDGREAAVDARLAQLEGVAVIQVQGEVELAALGADHGHRALSQVAQQGLIGVLALRPS